MGWGGDDALEQVRQLLEDRWNVNFMYEERQPSDILIRLTKQFTNKTPSTNVFLNKFGLDIIHKNKNKNNPSFVLNYSYKSL